MVIPVGLRNELAIEPGASIAFVLEDDGTLRLMTVKQGIKRAQAIAARYIKKRPGQSLVDEFIADRRAEAARE